MLILTVQMDCDAWHIPGIKEALAMTLERWGDARLLDVREARETVPEQLRIGDT